MGDGCSWINPGIALKAILVSSDEPPSPRVFADTIPVSVDGRPELWAQFPLRLG